MAKVVARVGEEAKVVVRPSAEGEPKYASAHDLRRSCADRLLNADVPEKVIQRVMRHSSWETTKRYYAPGSVQADARLLRRILVEDLGTLGEHMYPAI